MELYNPSHISKPLSDTERKTTIEKHLLIARLDYKAPATIPIVEDLINKCQTYEDNSRKNLQSVLSAVSGSLDILLHELFTCETDNSNLEHY